MRDSWPFGSRVKNLKMATPSGCLSLPRLLEFRVHELEARAVDGGDEAREDLLLGRRGVDADDELEHILILKSYYYCTAVDLEHMCGIYTQCHT